MLEKYKRSTKITTLIIIFPLITLLLYWGFSYIFFFYAKESYVKNELSRYEKLLLDSQKNNLVEKVENLTKYIRYYNYKSSDKIKREVKNIVDVSSDIANNIYEQYKNNLSESRLKEMIIHALEKVNYEKGTGYLFLIDMDGNVHMHIDNKQIGKNVLNLHDINGKYFIKEFMGVLEDHGEGYVDYYWPIPNAKDKKPYYKITYVKMLKMYNWYIGAGEYLKQMTAQLSKEILEYIRNNDTFKYGYFIISNSKNKIIFSPDKNSSIDINKFRIDGIYEDSKQIAYTAYVAEYDWYITAIKEMSEIKANIALQKDKSKRRIEHDIRTNIYLMAAALLVSILLSLYLSSFVNKMLKKYEAQLKESNDKLIFQSRQALIGELFSMIAHQWRQPINKIASILALLRFKTAERSLDYKELDEKYREIEDSIEFMSDTIDDFRTFYQPKEHAESADLKLLIEKAIDFVGGAIRKKDIHIVKKLENTNCHIYANEFLQVIINLIKNATDAVDERGKIVITLHSNDSKAIIAVEDNGAGIPQEQITKIFDPYYSTKKDSMGLGLYMSRMIVEKHLGGKIGVERLEHGICFRIILECR